MQPIGTNCISAQRRQYAAVCYIHSNYRKTPIIIYNKRLCVQKNKQCIFIWCDCIVEILLISCNKSCFATPESIIDTCWDLPLKTPTSGSRIYSIYTWDSACVVFVMSVLIYPVFMLCYVMSCLACLYASFNPGFFVF